MRWRETSKNASPLDRLSTDRFVHGQGYARTEGKMGCIIVVVVVVVVVVGVDDEVDEKSSVIRGVGRAPAQEAARCSRTEG